MGGTKMTEILSFTEAAKKHILKQITANGGNHFRLSIKRTGCSGYMYVPDIVSQAEQDDVIITQFDQHQILLDAKFVDLVQGTQVDYVSKSLGMKQLIFNNPNAESLCGCGESFTIPEVSND